MEGHGKVHTSIYLDSELHELLRQEAFNCRISQSELIRAALRQFLGVYEGREVQQEDEK